MLRMSQEVQAQTKLYIFDKDLLTENLHGLGSSDVGEIERASNECSLEYHASHPDVAFVYRGFASSFLCGRYSPY